MRSTLLLIIFVIIGFFALFFVRKYQVETAQKPLKNPLSYVTPYSIEIPPKNAMQGEMLSFSGDIFWEARGATQSVKLTEKKKILQGEAYETNDNGALSLRFPSAFTAYIAANTTVTFIQTLPENLVLVQNGGEATYEKLTDIHPLTIRFDALLIQPQKGTCTISYDPRRNRVLITDTSGQLTIAFNDADLLSNVVSLSKGESYRFDIDSKTGEVISE